MTESRRQSWGLIAGAAVSALLHLGIAAAFGLFQGGAAAGLPALDAPTDPEREETRLGIQQSDASTVTWIGYEDYQRHVAKPAEFDQAAMTRAQSNPQAVRSQPKSTPEISEDQRRRIVEQSGAAVREMLQRLAEAGRESFRAPEQTAPLGPPVPTADQLAIREKIQPDPARDAEAPESASRGAPQQSESEPETQPANTATPDEAQNETDRAASDTTKPVIKNARTADKEAPATSIETAIEVDPGKPVAARGLDIKTVHPEWSHYAMITASPRNPIAEIHFDRRGRVYTARLLRSTGRSDVDGPLLDALYRWRAEGKELDDLPPDVKGEPPQTARFVLTIKLR